MKEDVILNDCFSRTMLSAILNVRLLSPDLHKFYLWENRTKT